jgi:hypothetical protein
MAKDSKTSSNGPDNLVSIAGRFKPRHAIARVREYGSGNVNDTFLVTVDTGDEEKFILQRINTRVFRRPELVMRNMRLVTEHVREHLLRAPLGEGRRWEIPSVLPADGGHDYWIDPEGSFWRAISFIDNSRSFDTINGIGHAGEIGYALGTFHNLVSDLPAANLGDTLEGFHITPLYLNHYDEVLAGLRNKSKSPEAKYCSRFIEGRRESVRVLENAKTRGTLKLQPIHGDPKVNNVMIDSSTGQAVSIIDLDTVKPGLVHYDIGDCTRSCCNPMGEAPERWAEVRFEPDLCRAILLGYFSTAKDFFTEGDRAYLYDAIRLIAFELALRFFTDYLEGNVYFKVNHPEHNLLRALVQFKLTESIESQAGAIRAIIGDMG